MPANLTVTIEGQPRQFTCETLLTIGRSKSNDISLPDPKVSRGHALIRFLGDGEYYLIDLGSSNGTLINDKRVFVPQALKDADVIQIGSHLLAFRADDPPGTGSDDDSAMYTNPTMLTTSSSLQEIALLVADIRNYTTLSEQIPVELLSRVMGRWFDMVSRIVEENHGVIDKYIGDAVMVRWQTASGQDIDSCVNGAIATARSMHSALATLNSEFTQLPFILNIGVGINSGQAVLGNVGGGSRRDYTVLGDAVNLAFRLETASKSLKKDVVIAADCCSKMTTPDWTQYGSTVSVKGKKDPVSVYAFDFEELIRLLPPSPSA